ncbi:hypothetical protein KI614_09965 [Dechloromonas denitrificans]|jgi:hypothetical protein|uniref:DUF3106 domain-containing protein n=1 Tax=Dechloromonas denitrificans TaxID=281362 RepID=UPI001CF8E723|nr:DUF3106 domain-containing protein [Dechloromonas denitrificans]UCV10526.1 hypothetical protein KI614_09965 [Dechloromonas denitrificans]
MMQCATEKSGCVSRCLKIGLMAVAGIAAVTWIVMQLWNCLLPDIFLGVSPISYWQALGVLALSRILFGGLRGGCHGHWRERRERWEKMTPEERQQLKSRFGGRWSSCCVAGKSDVSGNVADKPADPA